MKKNKIRKLSPQKLILTLCCKFKYVTWSESKSHSVVSNSLQPHGIYSPWNLQARILEWVAFPVSRGSSQPRDRTQVSALQADSLPAEPHGKPLGRRHSRRGLVDAFTLRSTPISRSPLDKNPMPGRLPELHPTSEGNTNGQWLGRASSGKTPRFRIQLDKWPLFPGTPRGKAEFHA